jgi:hypothetical protein
MIARDVCGRYLCPCRATCKNIRRSKTLIRVLYLTLCKQVCKKRFNIINLSVSNSIKVFNSLHTCSRASNLRAKFDVVPKHVAQASIRQKEKVAFARYEHRPFVKVSFTFAESYWSVTQPTVALVCKDPDQDYLCSHNISSKTC